MPASFPSFVLLYFFILFSACKGLWLNVTRGLQNTGDLFTNLDRSASCRRAQCVARNGECKNQGSCCVCECNYNYATFKMNVDPRQATCVGNKDIRSFSGCTTLFENEDQGHPLATLDFSAQGSKNIVGLPRHPYSCSVMSAEYLDINWKQLPQKESNTFSLDSTGGWYSSYKLRWTGTMTSTYFGYIMKVHGECSKKGRDKQKGCIVFKAKGTLSRDLPNPTTPAPPVTTTIPTTTKTTTAAGTRKMTTSMKMTTTQAQSTAQVIVTTRRTSTTASTRKVSTTMKATTQAKSTAQVTKRRTSTTGSFISTVSSSSTVAKTKIPSSKETSQPTTEISTESSHTTEVLPTESSTGDTKTAIKPTYHSVGSEPNKNQNKLSGEKNEGDTMLIAIVAGVAAVICVAIVLLCMWLIVTQRRKQRHGASFGTGTTVIANPTTSSQNHFPMPGLLKNPVCEDAVYADPEEKVRKTAVGLLGNPSYETCNDLVLKNPRARDTQTIPLNNIRKKPLNTAKRVPPTNENTYDCADVRSNGGKPDAEKNVYQSLVKEEARPRYKPEVNVATYQSLTPDSLYQPLVKTIAPKQQDEIPEYLVLLNPNESPERTSPTPPEYQPPYSTGPPPADVEESPEYADYADLDELEEISANESSNRTSDHGPSYSAPLYNVLEGPGCEYASAPMYAVLEGPNPYSVGNINPGFESPFYAVLEGPESN